jgi:HPt (histidine-containing phosphotransfer) domain-containing protein
VNENNNVEIKQILPKLDVDLLQSYMDSLGKSIVEQMIVLYKQQAIIYLTDIEKAQLVDSATLWQEHCHKMKGASASVGLMRLHGLLVGLEKTTAQQTEKMAMLTVLKSENEDAIGALEQWLADV